MTIVFSSAVTGLDATDFEVLGATVSDLEGSGAAYTATVIGAAGVYDYSVRLPANAARGAHRGNAVSNTLGGRPAETVRPTVRMALYAVGDLLRSSIPREWYLDIRFSEPVDGLDGQDFINLQNLRLAPPGFQFKNVDDEGGRFYRAAFSAVGKEQVLGEKSVELRAGAVTDAWGNENIAARAYDAAADDVPPTVTLSGRPAPSGATWTLTLTFSKPVTRIECGREVLIASGVGAQVSDGLTKLMRPRGVPHRYRGDLRNYYRQYTTEVSGQGERFRTYVDERCFADRFGNPNPASEPFVASGSGETVRPAATLSGVPASSGTPWQMAIMFSEPVMGLAATDFEVRGATVSNLQGSGAAYSATVTGTAPSYSVRLPAGSADDGAGNGNVASNRIARDGTPPTVMTLVRHAPRAATVAAESLTWRLTFSEAVQNVASRNFEIEAPHGSRGLSNLYTVVEQRSDNVYDVTVAGASLQGINGRLGLRLAANHRITDRTGNRLTGGLPRANNLYWLDNIAPRLSSLRHMNPTNADSLVLRLVFTEPVRGVTTNDFTVSGTTATVTGVQDVDGGEAWDVTVSGGNLNGLDAAATQRVTLRLAADQNIEDLVGNDLTNLIPNVFLVPVAADIKAPAVASIERHDPLSEVTNADHLIWRVAFTEPVENVDEGDFTLSSRPGLDPPASVTGVARVAGGNGAVWDVTVSGGGLAGFEGRVTLGFAASQNIVDNDAKRLSVSRPIGANDFFEVRNTAPDASVRLAPAVTSGTVPFPVAIVFAHDVEGFRINGIEVEGGTASDLTGGGRTYGALITPNGTGRDIVIRIAANAARDAAGNSSIASPPVTVRYDATELLATLSGTPAPPGVPWTMTIVFSSAVTGLDATDFEVLGATVSDLEGSGAAYTATVIGAAGVYDYSVRLPANAARGAHRGNAVSNTLGGRPAETVRPTVRMALYAVGDLLRSSIPREWYLDIRFSEPVDGLDGQDFINLQNLRLAPPGFQFKNVDDEGGRFYRAAFSAVGKEQVLGEKSVELRAGAVTDAWGNENIAARAYDAAADDVPPTVTLSGRPAPSGATWTLTLTFSKPVTRIECGREVLIASGVGAQVSDGLTKLMRPRGVPHRYRGDLRNYYRQYTTEVSGQGERFRTYVDERCFADRFGNPNPASEPFVASGSGETVRPAATLSGVPASSGTPWQMAIMFSEPVMGLAATDFEVRGATVSNLQGSGAAYSATVTGTAPSYSVRLPAGSADDGAGNGNVASNRIARDGTPPTVMTLVRHAPRAATVAAESLTWRLTFSEAVQNVASRNFEIEAPHGSRGLSNLYTVVEQRSDNVYDVTVAGASLQGINGRLGLRLAANHRITDRTGNRLTGGLPRANNLYTLDLIVPTALIENVPAIVSSQAPFVVTIMFSEAVTGFESADLRVTNGTAAGAIITEPGNRYKVTVTPDGVGDLVLNVAKGAVQDIAGNDNVASSPVTVVFAPSSALATDARITAAPESLVADGNSTSTITVQLRDANNNDLTASGGTVRLATDLGALGAVRDNNDGTYTAMLTSATTAGTATVSGTLDGTALTDMAQVVFTAAPGVTLSAQAVSVAEDGGTATYTVVLDSEPTGDVTVTPSSSDTGAATVSAALTFTAGNWDQPQSVTVTGVNDAIDNPGDERSATISHAVAGGGYGAVQAADVIATVTDDDGAGITLSAQAVSVTEDGGTATYTVVLDSQPTGDVTVTPSSSDTGAATVAPVLTFTAGNWDQPQSVTVTGVNDAIDNPGDERSTTISHAVAGGGYGAVQAADVIATVTDDDGVGLTLSAQAVSVAEDGGTATYTVVLDSEPTGDVTVTPSSSDPGAATVAPVLTFTAGNWDQPQSVTVTGVNDAIDNPGDERSATISHAVAGGGYGAVQAADVIATVTDDDGAGITLSAQAVSVAEDGGTATYTVVLDSQPTGDVTVTPSSSDTGAATVAPVLTFTAGNWDQPQSLTVTGVNDAIDNPGDERSATISHAVAGGGYGAVQAADVAVTVSDDDGAGITLSAQAVSVAEDGGTATYTVVLDSQPTGDVTVTPSSSDTGAATVAPVLTFTAQNWDQPQSLTVTGVNDAIDNPGDERSATISHAVAGGGYGAVQAADVIATVTDDDGAGITLSAQAVSVAEDGGSATYTVVLDSQPTGDVTVTPSSSDTGAATVSAALTFTAGNWDQPQSLTVTGVNDAIDNPGDERSATISHAVAGGGYGAVQAADVAVTVNDDDGAGIPVVPEPAVAATATITAAPTSIVANGTSTATITMQLRDANGNTLSASGGTVTLATDLGMLGAVTDNGDGTYTATLTSATTTGTATVSGQLDGTDITDTTQVVFTPMAGVTVVGQTINVAENGGTETYTVALTAQPSGDVTVTPLSSDTAAATVSGPLTFSTANWDRPQTVTVTGINDDIDNANDARSVTISHAVAGGGYGAVQAADVAITLIDDDDAGVTVKPVAGLVTTEAGGTDTFTIVLDSQPIDDVTIGLTSSDTTEGTVAPSSLTFETGNWNTPQTVTVSGVDDGVTDGDIAYTIETTASSADVGYDDIVVDDISVINEDDDTTGSVVFAVSSEDAGTVQFRSDTEVLNVSVAVSGTTGRSDVISVPVGGHEVSYVLPTGFSATGASCSPATNDDNTANIVNTRDRRISLSVMPGAEIECTLNIEDAAARTTKEINAFMEERAWLIMSHRSDRHRRIARLKDERLGASLKIHGHTVPGRFSSPLSLEMDASEGAEKLQVRFSCTQGTSDSELAHGAAGNACGSNDWWLEGTVGRYSRGEAKGSYAITHAGIDRLVSENVLIGLGVQYDRVTRNGKGDRLAGNRQAATFRSDGWMAGPYVTWRLNDRLYFDAGISAGTATNRIAMTDGGASGTFNSQRFSGYATLLGDFDHGRWNIRPQLGFSWYQETAKAWTGTGVDGHGVAVPDVHVSTGDLEAGVRFTHTLEEGFSSQYFEIEGVLALAGNTDKENQLRIGAGLTAGMPFGGVLDAGISFDGLGDDDWQDYALRFGYSVAPYWLPGTVEAGLSFDGSGVEELDFRGLTLGFRSDPDPWVGGILTTTFSFNAANKADTEDDDTQITTGRSGDDGSMSVRFGYSAKF